MGLVNRVISNLFGGVSQQPAGIRLDSQCEEMINAYPSIADGMTKRPPTEFVAALTSGSVVLSVASPYTGGTADLSWVPTGASSQTGIVVWVKAGLSGEWLTLEMISPELLEYTAVSGGGWANWGGTHEGYDRDWRWYFKVQYVEPDVWSNVVEVEEMMG